MEKINVGLIFGGQSEEHEISIMTAREIVKAIDKNKYEISLFGIDRNGYWKTIDKIEEELETLNFEDKNNKISGSIMEKLQNGIDIVFPLLHGPYGEDGKIQGLFDMLGIPFVGCTLVASAICMDKDYTKKLLQRIGVPVTKSFTAIRYESIDFDMVEKELGYPMFVKPVNLGSSIGISKVKNIEELKKGVKQSFMYDNKVIIEEGINARELECAVLGNDNPEASVVGEIISSHEFYDYEAKYFDGGKSELIIPAEISEMQAKEIKDYAIKAYVELGCSGLSRIDFFIDKETGKIYLNEINTMPGFTPISMYPRLWRFEGVEYDALLDRLIQLGLKD
ncbi:MAG: D-alanine--D-alanine ligase family protein [Bacillota bacterium]|nr:D-alanine--D-alanine ligase family protein [Bacillota bacterium]